MSSRVLAWLLIAATLATILMFARPPLPGGTYRYRATEPMPDSEGAAILRYKNGCFYLIAAARNEKGYDRYAIALAKPVGLQESKESKESIVMYDNVSKIAIRAGQAFEGRIFSLGALSGGDWWSNSLRAGWPISQRCGDALMVVAGISRLQPISPPDELH